MTAWFAETSQAMRWTLSLDEQDRMRREVIEHDLAQQQQLGTAEAPSPAPAPQLLLLQLQQELVLHYQSSCIYQICSDLRRSWRLRATAVVYFRRFYLRRSLWDVDPRAAIVGCIFLAGKTDHDYVDVSRLLEGYFRKGTEQQILDVELQLLETLGYDLQVFHAQNCLHGLIADFKRHMHMHSQQMQIQQVQSQDGSSSGKMMLMEAVPQWTERAIELCDAVLLTGLYLACTPSELAIRVALKTVPAQLAAEFEAYLRTTAQTLDSASSSSTGSTSGSSSTIGSSSISTRNSALHRIMETQAAFDEQCNKAGVGRDLSSDGAVAEIRGAMQALSRAARWGSSSSSSGKNKTNTAASSSSSSSS